MAKYPTCRAYAESTEEGKRILEEFKSESIDVAQRENKFSELIELFHLVGSCEGESASGPPVLPAHLPVKYHGPAHLDLSWLVTADDEGYRLADHPDESIGALVIGLESHEPTDVLFFSDDHAGPSLRVTRTRNASGAIMLNGKVERMRQELVDYLDYLLHDLDAEAPGDIVWL